MKKRIAEMRQTIEEFEKVGRKEQVKQLTELVDKTQQELNEIPANS
jgi:hypothetical protein